MDALRKPFLALAIVLSVVIVLLEIGAGAAPRLRAIAGLDTGDPPGIAIMSLALIDAQLVFATVLYGLGVVLPHPLVGRIQGCAGCLLSLVLIMLSIVAIVVAFLLLLLMISLIASFFGIAVYIAVFGDFARSEAGAVLFILLVLKLAMGGSLVLAHQRFLQNIGLVILVILSLVLNIVIAFLHDLPPGFLTSITDAIAAIIVAIVAIVWSILLLIGAVIAVLRVIRPPQPIGQHDEAISR